MSENITGHKDRELDKDPLAPVTRGREFIEDHYRGWLGGDSEIVTPEALATLVEQLHVVYGQPDNPNPA